MRRVAHLSDLHFGRVDQTLVGPLIEVVNALKPDLVAVSGDLTQRARSSQFRQARDFLKSLPGPQVIVPGNHDVPLHNVFARLTDPLEKYRRYITDDLRPFYLDDEIALLGVNTARSLTIKGGRINLDQVKWMREKLCQVRSDVVKIVVTHHPFDVPEGFDDRVVAGGSRRAMLALAECGADLFLAGHLHVGQIGHATARFKISGYRALVVQAGTASSTRGRGEANSFNLISIHHPQITIERYQWTPELKAFTGVSSERFAHSPTGWQRVSSAG